MIALIIVVWKVNVQQLKLMNLILILTFGHAYKLTEACSEQDRPSPCMLFEVSAFLMSIYIIFLPKEFCSFLLYSQALHLSPYPIEFHYNLLHSRARCSSERKLCNWEQRLQFHVDIPWESKWVDDSNRYL